MTKEREQLEHVAMEVIDSWTGENDAFLRAAALSYAKGLRDGAQIMANRMEKSMSRVAAPHNLMY